MKKTTTSASPSANSTFFQALFRKILFFIFIITTVSLANAQSATALKFDGADDYVALPDITSGFTTGQVSGEAWIYANSLPPWASIMKNWTENTQGMFHFGADDFSSVLSIYIGEADGNAVSVSSSILLSQGQWYHVAFSANGSVLRLYINGNEVGSAPYDGTLYTGVSATFLGAKPGDSGTSPASSLAGYWDGYMDEVRIWNRGLSQSEIQDHMNCELSGSQTGLVAYYKMNQGIVGGDNTTVITAFDESGNNNTAVLSNFSLTGFSSNWASGIVGSMLYYADADSDGYGDATVSIAVSCVAPSGYVSNSLDCNDADNSVHPGAAEACNELDDDCDGSIDESCGVTYTYYFDGDGDGYGKPDFPLTTTNPFPPLSYSTLNGDCNDGNVNTNPGATEVCDGVDNNCDGNIDESCVVMYTFYYDGDGDGYGSPSGILTTADSVAPEYYVAYGDDCNDGNPNMHPGAADPCNYLDDDCDGITDEGCGPLHTYYFDSDYDGYGVNDFVINIYDAFPPPAFAVLDGDCDNYNFSINPGRIEFCNSIDDDCSGITDDDCVPILLPDFTKADINGVTHHLFEDLSEGNAVILEFSAGWCGPSLSTEPKISKVYDDICQGQGNIKLYDLVFETDNYGVVSDNEFGSHYSNRHNITYPIITGSSDVFSVYGDNYANYYIPWFLVIIPDTANPQNSTVHQIIGDEPFLTDSIEHFLIAGGYTITAPEELTISVTGDVCDLPSPVTLTSSAATGNLWSTGDTTQSITITGGGEYYLYHESDCGMMTKKMYIDDLLTSTGTLSLPSGNTVCSGTNGVFQLEYTGTPATIQYSTDSINWAEFALNYSGTSYFGNLWSIGTTVYFRSISSNENSSVLGSCEVYSNVVQLHVEDLATKPQITVIDSACSFPFTLQSFSAVNNMWSTGDTTEVITVTDPDYYYVVAPQTCGLAFAIIYIWNADAMTWYADTDNDGYGDAANSIESCSTPEGYTDNSQDCDDTKNTVHPYAQDICNGIDDDCSGTVDDGAILPLTGYVDGNQKVCAGEAGVIYTVEASANALYYQWYLTSGITSSAGSTITTTNSISLDFSNSFTGGSVSVLAIND